MSDICRYCGGEIIFRYQEGVLTPIHLTGGCSYDSTGSLSESKSAETEEDFCRPAVCEYCGADIFFVRHNGGSVWFDELGWPWPKHPCYHPEDVSGLGGPAVPDFEAVVGPNSDLCLVVFAEPVTKRRTQLTAKRHTGKHLRITVAGVEVGLVGELITMSEERGFLTRVSRPRQRILIVDATDCD